MKYDLIQLQQFAISTLVLAVTGKLIFFKTKCSVLTCFAVIRCCPCIYI